MEKRTFELENNEQVVLNKMYDDSMEKEKYANEVFLIHDGIQDGAKVNFEKEEDRDKMFESFTQENAQEFRDFMYQSVLNREVPTMPLPEEQGVIDGSEGAKIISMNPDNQ